MKPLEWLALAALGVLGYFFWKNSSQPSASPTCPAQTQLDGWLSDIATGKMTTSDANKLAASYALANPPCADAVSAINAAIAAKGGLVMAPLAPAVFATAEKAPVMAPLAPAVFATAEKAPIGKALAGVPTAPSSGLVPHYLTDSEAAESFVDFANTAGFPGLLTDFLAANPELAIYAPAGGWPPATSFRYTFSDSGTTSYPAGHSDTFIPTGRFAPGGHPTYTRSSGLPGEWMFASWNAYTNDAPGGGYRPAPSTGGADSTLDPTPVTSSDGQRLYNMGVWVWSPGTQVMIKGDSPAAATAGVGVGHYPSPLLAAEPWL